ncbi:proline dehydrogenase family protein [Frigoribacterium faeni]|uniref:L-glutamate gamma-semialdehyde dehydrogenase n=1 Tax=Frigoribacterium faeni TaxID=145483 RepID=A0A7W3PJE4_9MICO|nr:bifunctional proline dehydrogenase/L-glutamate gamma-semialdehyde dehydrogenase [Frigoribacterium faeni]MBA8813881.1 RHH-type proline utilization regulon transcriptional repressor/proline dehydrogenase/delta 1-pyrroline-5-carboxylate dehydrogenase [Frigoribacterium faeni]BFF15208.1 bifunctional proline dehydrogenase/L-glutamate gamma-semialdehyde dehydrogenase [Microbacterium flavescens]GEK82143.1 1-pyrroline-5-carboxylate dehydrogenase [Frigoribacterium faeni]
MTTIDETAGPSTAAQFPVGATGPAPAPTVDADLPAGLGDDAVALARRWAHEASSAPSTGSAHLLAQVLKDESGLAFTIGFVDRVVRPEDLGVAARNLSTLAKQAPSFLPWHMRGAVRLGGVMAPVLPGVVVPIARRVLRGMVGHLIADARPARLGAAIAKIRKEGTRLNLNLLGEAVLGDAEAEHRLAGTRALLARDDVDYVSIKVSSIVSQLSMWAFDETVERVVEKLTPLYELAARSPKPKFINLDMEEYRDLDLTIAVFTRLLDQPQLRGLEAGIVLQTYLPDALGALQGLTEWATARVDAGGASIKVRVVKGANLAMETVDATVHEWPLATYGTKQDSDTNYKRVLAWAFTPERARAVKIGVAGHNLFDIAFAHLLAEARGVSDRVEFEMLLGMAEGQAELVKADVGGLLLYTPVVHPREFDVAISYLIRRLEENASSENFMSAVFELASNEAMFEREKGRFLASLAEIDGAVPAPHRVQSRLDPAQALQPRAAGSGFDNEPDTDPALAANRAWGRGIAARSADSRLGVDLIEAARVTDTGALDAIVADAVEASAAWAARGGAGRAAVLRAAAATLSARRADLMEVAASETGKTVAEGDVEVSEAIDFATWYAHLAEELDAVDGADFVPARLTLITPPWNFPLAIPAGSTLAALAAGSSVVIKPAGQAKRSGAVMVQALWDAGVPPEVLKLVDVDEGDLGRHLVSHPSVDRVILTGAFETAALFTSWRTDLPLLAETSGKNAIIVTPSADLDLAASDVIKSAFGHAGQKCSAASLVILVGSVATSERFRRQLVDAASTMRVGLPSDPTTQMGPIIEPAHGKLERALTTLGAGESWLVEPRRLDDSGRLWSPGVRAGVAAGSEFHLTEYFGPVLGIMTASTLDEAIELQNATDYGLTAGLHTLDPAELSTWLDRVEAGNLYVNRGITGAIVRRQPFGGWKKSSVGAGAKAGGPNYLVHLGSWRPTALSEAQEARPGRAALAALEAATPLLGASGATAHDELMAAAASDEHFWATEFGVARDVSDLGLERDLLRYRPLPVTVRAADGAAPADVVRVLLAGLRSGAPLTVSTSIELPAGLVSALGLRASDVRNESDAAWHDRVRSGGLRTERVRLVTDGGDVTGASSALADALGGDPAVAVFAAPVTPTGRLELLPFLREQAVAITAHRFGNPDPWSAQVI